MPFNVATENAANKDIFLRCEIRKCANITSGICYDPNVELLMAVISFSGYVRNDSDKSRSL